MNRYRRVKVARIKAFLEAKQKNNQVELAVEEAPVVLPEPVVVAPEPAPVVVEEAAPVAVVETPVVTTPSVRKKKSV